MLRSPYDMSRPSVVRLSSVTFVRPSQRVQHFVNILHHLIAQWLGQFLVNFWNKNLKGF